MLPRPQRTRHNKPIERGAFDRASSTDTSPEQKKSKIVDVIKIKTMLQYHIDPRKSAGNDQTRWYRLGRLNIAMVSVYEPGTRMGTKDGSNFCVHMAHRKGISNSGDWFDTEEEMHLFIIGELEGK